MMQRMDWKADRMEFCSPLLSVLLLTLRDHGQITSPLCALMSPSKSRDKYALFVRLMLILSMVTQLKYIMW